MYMYMYNVYVYVQGRIYHFKTGVAGEKRLKFFFSPPRQNVFANPLSPTPFRQTYTFFATPAKSLRPPPLIRAI